MASRRRCDIFVCACADENVIPERRVSDASGISRFPDAQLRVGGLVLTHRNDRRRVGKAKRAHRLLLAERSVGTAQERLCPPYIYPLPLRERVARMSEAKFEPGEGSSYRETLPLTHLQRFAFRAPSPARGEGRASSSFCRYTASTRSSISAMVLTPHRPMVVESSLRMMTIAFSTPGPPKAPRP